MRLSCSAAHFLVAALITTLAGLSAAQLTVSELTAAGTADTTYSWTLSKQLQSSATISLTLGSTATANYLLTVARTLSAQTVRVKGTFRISIPVTGSEAVPAPSVTFSTAASSVSPQVTCVPAGSLAPGASTSCNFDASWSDTQPTAAQTGTVTVNPGAGGTAATGRYDITGGTASTGAGPSSCATLSDAFSIKAGSTTLPSSVATYSTNINGMQICDSNTYPYTVTFSNFDASVCGTPITAINTATLSITGSSTPKTQSQTVTITVTGCTGSSVSVSGIQTTVINTYTWQLTKTGGGSGLQADPATELPIPFTITATQNAPKTVGYVAGKVNVQNSGASSNTISAVTVTISGQQAQTIPVSNCASATLQAQGTTSCTFNLTNPAAPAAGTVTAAVTFAAGTPAVTSSGQAFDYQSAATFSLGGTATIYDTVKTDGLRTLLGTVTGAQTAFYRFAPSDQHPPTTAPGLTLDGSRTFTYNMVIAKLGACYTGLTVTNTATLTPGGGSTQGPLTASASATFDVGGCNVLPTLSLINVQQWAAITWSWQMRKAAVPAQYQFALGQGGTASYEIILTRTRQTGNYWLSGTLRFNNPATYPLYISTVTFVGTSGQWSQPANCLGGGTVGPAVAAAVGPGSIVGPTVVGAGGGVGGRFVLAAGAQIDCLFNVSAPSGAPPQGTVQALATTSTASVGTAVVGLAGSPVQSVPYSVNFVSPTQQWDIGGCVTFGDSATTQGSAGAWVPQMTGLPQQQQICDSRTWTYTGAISAVPTTGAVCNQGVTIINNAQAVPIGGGSSVTASASIQVMAINCPGTTPPPLPPAVPTPVVPAPTTPGVTQSLQPLIVTINPGVAASTAGVYLWTVALTNSVNGNIIMPYGDNRQVQYTVNATRSGPTPANTVAGQVTVANPNTTPLSVSSVSVTVSGAGAAVAAKCPTTLPIVLPAGGNIVCSFSAAANSTDPGTVSAAANSPAGAGSTTAAVPYKFSVAASAEPLGKCAVLSDQIAPLPVLTATSFAVAQNRPAGNNMTVCLDTTYSFEATLGPFTKTNCGVQTVVATATATPLDGLQQSDPPTAQSNITLEIDGCQSILATNDVTVVVSQPTTSSISGLRWRGSGSAPTYRTKVKYDQTAKLQYALSYNLVPDVTGTLSGVVTLNNPTEAAVNITKLRVAPEFMVSPNPNLVIPVVEATCPNTTVGPKSLVQCTYTSTFRGSGSGIITAFAVLQTAAGTVKRVQSDSLSFSLKQGATAPPETCAEVITGLTMGTALLLPGAAGSIKFKTTQVCQSGNITVTQPVGPFPISACGIYMVVSVMRVRPLNGRPTIQDAFAVITPAQLDVVGCPLTVTPQPMASIADQINPSSVVRYGWKADISTTAANPLVVQYNKAKDIVVTASVTRLQGMRSASVQGSVQLQGQGTSELSVYKVQAAGLARTGELVVVNTTCPSGSISDGQIVVPPPPDKVLCTFEIDSLPPMDGPVLALVYADQKALMPLPTDPGKYRLALAPKVVQGECVQVGTSRSLTRLGSQEVVRGQPSRAGQGLPTTPICQSSSINGTLTFGPFKSNQCGKYMLNAGVAADLTNSPTWAYAQLKLEVDVVGC